MNDMALIYVVPRNRLILDELNQSLLILLFGVFDTVQKSEIKTSTSGLHIRRTYYDVN